MQLARQTSLARRQSVPGISRSAACNLISPRSKRNVHIAKAGGSLETISIDEASGELVWDVAATADAWPTDNLASSLLQGYEVRPGKVPAASPTSTLPTRPDSLNNSKKPVVLVRDTNAWCPFCERVWLALEEKGIPYDCVLVELYNKPSWYKDIVPTSLVPAVSFPQEGNVVWESKDILLELERRFAQAPPLLPTDEEEKEKALAFLGELEEAGLDKHGYSFMTGGRMVGRSAASSSSDLADLQALKTTFLHALDWFENNALARYPDGPFLLGSDFSLLDIMVISSMERIAAGLPKFQSFNLRNNPDYPNTGAWFSAIAARPAYQKVCSDDQTLQLLFQRMMGLSAGAAAAATSASAAAAAAAAMAAFAKLPEGTAEDAAAAASAEEEQAAREEAAGKLQSCLVEVIKDILAKSGVTRYQSSPYGATTRSVNGHQPRVALPVREAVEQQVLRVLKALVMGSPGAKPDTSVAAAFGAVTAAFLRNRYHDCGKLADLGPAAVKQLQTACTQALTQTYADGVEALVFVPPGKSGASSSSSSSPEAAAAAGAASEAATKIQMNKQAIVDDILNKSGLARPGTSVYGSTYMSVNGHKPVISAAVRTAVEVSLDRLCSMLLTGDAGPKAEDPEAAAVGAAALAFFRNRASAPRDMSAAATVQFRAACDAVLAQVY